MPFIYSCLESETLGILCIFLVGILINITRPLYRILPLLIFCELCIYKLTYSLIYVDLHLQIGPWLYLLYSIISIFAMYYIYTILPTVTLLYILFINIVYNICVSLSFFFFDEFISFYSAYGVITGILMLLEVIFCGALYVCGEYMYKRYGIRDSIMHINSTILFWGRASDRRANRKMV